MMKRFCIGVCALLCFVAVNPSSLAQDNPWNGSWKADPATVKFSGAPFRVAVDTDGFTVTRGGKANPKVVCDAAPHQTADGTMTTCTKSDTGFALEVTKDGKQVRKTTLTVSADGKTRTSTSEFFPADDSPYTMTSTAMRVSGGPGMAGDWKEMKVVSSLDQGILSIAVSADSVAFKETDNDKPVNCKLDGTETKFGDGGTMSVKMADPHTLKVTYRGDGTVRRENTFVLSADGKIITETDVTPDPSPSTLSLTFHKV